MALLTEPRSIPIRQSLLRPELVMGGEREPVMTCAMMAIIIGAVGAVQMVIITVFLALIFYFGSILLFRRMAKADPKMFQIWLRHIRFQHYYPAQTPYWVKTGYKK